MCLPFPCFNYIPLNINALYGMPAVLRLLNVRTQNRFGALSKLRQHCNYGSTVRYLYGRYPLFLR